MLPLGDWHCPNCICKFCGDASGSAADENDTAADELIRCSFCEKKCNSFPSSLFSLKFHVYLYFSFPFDHIFLKHKDPCSFFSTENISCLYFSQITSHVVRRCLACL